MNKEKRSVMTVDGLPVRTGTIYPPEFGLAVAGRSSLALGNPFDLTQFGVNLVTLEPGAWSSQRHWHECEDEWVYAMEGEMVLVDSHGRHPFNPGMFAGFKANDGNGHHIVNESSRNAIFLVVGTRADADVANYPDIDMKGVKRDGKFVMTRKDGSLF
jgi:uncharacterized cupin superfamily protein